MPDMGKTLFASVLQGVGLSQSDAAEFLGVRRETIAQWGSGRRVAPPFAMQKLHALAQEQREACEKALAHPAGYASAGDVTVARRAWELSAPPADD
jgi:DNA-binding XRE family transcriptional regulator